MHCIRMRYQNACGHLGLSVRLQMRVFCWAIAVLLHENPVRNDVGLKMGSGWASVLKTYSEGVVSYGRTRRTDALTVQWNSVGIVEQKIEILESFALRDSLVQVARARCWNYTPRKMFPSYLQGRLAPGQR